MCADLFTVPGARATIAAGTPAHLFSGIDHRTEAVGRPARSPAHLSVVKRTEFFYGAACLKPGSYVVTGAGTPVGGYSSGVVAPFTGTARPGMVTTMAQTNGFGQAIPYYGAT